MHNLCLIPARGGSKRIPKKNIKDFFGKPMLAYPIETALKSGLFSEIMVSTDDNEITEIALKHGANVPFFRSAKTADDYATTADVILEVIKKYSESGIHFDNICCLYACTPLLGTQHLIIAYEKLITEKKHSLFPVVEFEFPVQRALKIIDTNVEFVYSEHALTRSQDLEHYYHDAGQFYWINVKSFLKTNKIVGDNSGCIVLNRMDCQDIDVESDWKIAELKYTLKNRMI
ncbi:MAG: pseudaminic acid cytidylyltransferase [Saprospiraceae bacterium]|nr:pseudaminic acid cytidylyltransferase [Saprospiraceae bacterium]MBK6565861.1 pseudaminic acid cytidylyltransferase [Saprospiraceae bacterium]MBK8370128.1 pseudaminic acid cytidylyltransferase [Saprospiraceae bacterium]MBK8546860.1 pseudaminic acid cytidylyltransferase [Saprospiraceae bacterium]MBK8856033.1 pseudaminic acid cytidylyltransferase [Saprospiraceae bacterium]